MTVEIIPRVLSGSVSAPCSKSDAIRVLIASALCEEPTQITMSCESDDILAAVRCLCALGAETVPLCNTGTRFVMRPLSAAEITGAPVLDCKESGTALRLLLPVAAALGVSAEFTACGRLPDRPILEFTAALESNGCSFSSQKLPFKLSGRLKAGEYTLPGNISSQYISGLLFALPLMEGSSRITLKTKLESSSYVEMTLNTLRKFGISVKKTDGDGYTADGKQRYKSAGSAEIEGDWSNAAFFLAAGAFGGTVTVNNLPSASLQGDRAIERLLRDFGADVKTAGKSGVSVCAKELRGMDIDVSETPDLFPVLAVAASAAHGTTRLVNAARLRMKESDRIHTVAVMLKGLGADVLEQPDSLIIHGRPYLTGGAVDGAGDHRIVMAAALASVLCKNTVTIFGAEAVNKSYPQFFKDFSSAGGQVCVIDNR